MKQNWSQKNGPRERLIKEGAEILSDAELLAIILRTGLAGKSVLELAQELLDQFGGIRGLLKCESEQLRAIKGLGPAKFTQILAISTIAQRSLMQQLESKPEFTSSKQAARFLLSKMRDYTS